MEIVPLVFLALVGECREQGRCRCACVQGERTGPEPSSGADSGEEEMDCGITYLPKGNENICLLKDLIGIFVQLY